MGGLREGSEGGGGVEWKGNWVPLHIVYEK